jgi:hypothetical protein
MASRCNSPARNPRHWRPGSKMRGLPGSGAAWVKAIGRPWRRPNPPCALGGTPHQMHTPPLPRLPHHSQPARPLPARQVLTKAGFKTKRRDAGRGSSGTSEAILAKREERLQRLHKVTQSLVMAWGLSALCFIGHLAHVLPAAPAWLHALHAPPVSAALSAAALLGARPTPCWPATRPACPAPGRLAAVRGLPGIPGGPGGTTCRPPAHLPTCPPAHLLSAQPPALPPARRPARRPRPGDHRKRSDGAAAGAAGHEHAGGAGRLCLLWSQLRGGAAAPAGLANLLRGARHAAGWVARLAAGGWDPGLGLEWWLVLPWAASCAVSLQAGAACVGAPGACSPGPPAPSYLAYAMPRCRLCAGGARAGGAGQAARQRRHGGAAGPGAVARAAAAGGRQLGRGAARRPAPGAWAPCAAHAGTTWRCCAPPACCLAAAAPA